MITTDTHVHSFFSSDSTEKPESIIETAIAKGLTSIYFTDHHDIDFPVQPTEPDMTFQLDFASYVPYIHHLKEVYAGKLQIYLGIELGICPEIASKTSTLVNQYPFDYVIGSSHLTSLHNGDPYYPSYYTGKTPVQAYREYFMSEAENLLLTDDFDVYGHLDYAIRYCPDPSFEYRFEDYGDIFEILLKRIVEKGKGIEINTSGIAKIGYPHPHIEALKLYKQLGGEIITVGSDAHRAEQLGVGFAAAEELLKQVGFHYYTVFSNRQPSFIKL